MRSLRVVAYAVNGSGLGHLTRVLAILRWARRLARFSGYRLEAYVLTSSEGSALAFEEGFAAFKIPSKTSIRDAGIPKPDYLRLAKQWVWHSLGLINPDILLVDTFPGGSFGELLHALDGPRARVFIFRAMRPEFAESESMRALLPLYDRILIPDEPGREPQRVDPALRSRVERFGPILLRSRDELRLRPEARVRLGIPGDRLAVWVGAGGGGDPTAVGALHEIVGRLGQASDLHLVIGAGPLYRGEPLRAPNITWLQNHRAAEDFLGLDFALSAAGFNSFHELLHAGVPSAFFAQHKIADEQHLRVAAAVLVGAALELETDSNGIPEATSIGAAVARLRDKSERERLSEAARDFVPRNFARDAAYALLATVIPERVLDEASELATPRLFQTIGRAGLDLDEVDRLRSALERLDAPDREPALVRLLDAGVAAPSVVARLFPLVTSRFSPHGDLEPDDAIEVCLRVVAGLARHGDERAALAMLRMIPAEKGARARQASDRLVEYLEILHDAGESLWRAMSVLARHQGEPGSERDILDALAGACAEITAQAQRKVRP